MAINLIDRPETLLGQSYQGGKLSTVGSLFIMYYLFSVPYTIKKIHLSFIKV